MDALRPHRVLFGIKAKDHRGRFLPARPVRISIEKTQIVFQMFTIIGRERSTLRRFILDWHLYHHVPSTHLIHFGGSC